MGYTLTIGEAELDWDEEGCSITAEVVTLPEAPKFGEDCNEQTSTRWPSYSTWADSMRKLGLMDVMFDHRNGGAGNFEWNGVTRYPLIAKHPGASPISKEHVELIRAKLDAYKKQYPTHIPKFPPLKPDAKPLIPNSKMYAQSEYVDDPKYDAALLRGEWLLWWCDWAVQNCERPVFVNR